MQVKCNSGIINELYLNLKGIIEPDTKLADLLATADANDQGCSGGRVDRVGF